MATNNGQHIFIGIKVEKIKTLLQNKLKVDVTKTKA